MSLTLALRNHAAGKWLRRFFWTHPEWWSLLLAALAWLALLPHAGAYHEHLQHSSPVPQELMSWCLMVVAMMVPLVLVPLRWVAFQSFRNRRHRAILLFLLGFLSPWLLAGVVIAWLRTFEWSHNSLIAPGLFALAAFWILAPARNRALLFCHRTMPLAPTGWNADRDCLRFSFLVGSSCIATCGFLMLACAFTGHSLIAMLGGAVLGALEYRSWRPVASPVLISGSLMLAVWFLLPTS